ncbi:MAG TPA: type 4a pilus biogenesis protein PilO [Acidimicrobiia bacterium]|nr:type 4a pilus biogenesis protein PilO [Acidimicrobiia bacterium]
MARKPILVGLLLLLLGVVWWFFFFSPKVARVDELRADLQVAQDEELRLRARVADLQSVAELEPEYRGALDSLSVVIPDDPELDEIIDSLYDLALRSRVELLSLVPGYPSEPSDGEGLRSIVVTTRLTGEYFEVVNFLFGVNDLPRLARVDAIALSVGADGEGGLGVSLQIRFFTLSGLLPEPLEPVLPIDDTTTTTVVDVPPPTEDPGDTGDDGADTEG